MRRLIYLSGLIFVALLGIWLPLPFPFPIRLVAVTFLVFFVPGWLLLKIVRGTTQSILEDIVLACGISYGLIVLGALGLVYITGHLSSVGVAGLLTITILLLLMVYAWQFKKEQVSGVEEKKTLSRLDILYFSIPVVVAAFFTFTNLSYADYWGDEMNGLLRAISVIAGRPESIFEHTKGPVEVLLPAVFGLLVERFDPFALRFSFALAFTIGVGAFYVLVQRLFDRNVALLAGLILAINGLHLAFGRIVQYQSVVFLMTNLSVLLAYVFYRTGKGRLLGLSCFFAAIGLWAHYDMLLVLPVLGYFVWYRYGKNWFAWRGAWPQLVGAGIIFLGVITIFYFPFLLNPQASETSSYLARRISISNLISNNFDELYIFSVVNNSSYYVIFVMLFSLGCIVADLRSVAECYKNIWLWLMVGGAFGLSILAVILGQLFLVPAILFTLLFVLLVGFSSATIELRSVYFWLGVSFIGYVFLVEQPRSHLRIIYPALSILAALGVFRLATALLKRFAFQQRRSLVVVGVTSLGLLFVLFAVYEYLLFVDTESEYVFTYPDHKSVLYWEDPEFPFGSRRLYGAPHRLGWQMINDLYLQDYFEGDWGSNDEGSNLFWYTLGAPQNPCFPQYYFLTQFEQKLDSNKNVPDLVGNGYLKVGEVWNRDRLQIEVFKFAPLGYNGEVSVWSEPDQYGSFVTPADFQSLPYENIEITLEQINRPRSPQPIFKPHPEVLKQVAEQYEDPRINNVHDKFTLLGYDLDETWAEAGGAVVLTLYWQAVDNVNLPYKIFAHLESRGESPQLWSQADDLPACGTQLTHHWSVGDIVADRHVLHLPQDIPPGDYDLTVGLYEPKTNLRLDVLDSMGNPAGVSFQITTITLPGSSDKVDD